MDEDLDKISWFWVIIFLLNLSVTKLTRRYNRQSSRLVKNWLSYRHNWNDFSTAVDNLAGLIICILLFWKYLKIKNTLKLWKEKLDKKQKLCIQSYLQYNWHLILKKKVSIPSNQTFKTVSSKITPMPLDDRV